MELAINKKQLSVFRCIVSAYMATTMVPEQGRWKGLANSKLWLRHVEQVMVVGSAGSKGRLDKLPHLQQQISFDALQQIRDETTLGFAIHDVLQSAGTRYVGQDVFLSAKTRALVNNFQFVKDYPGQFTGLLHHLADYRVEGAERERVAFLMQHLKFMKNKSARDYLMGLGLNRNTLALDVRIQNTFKQVGIQFPPAAQLAQVRFYDSVEQQIIEKLCVPLGIEPVVLDRVLFQNYRRIMQYDYHQLRLFY